ncbi:hypothetical protein SAMN02745823_03876 [Sporobacter termitidis DSM 10068]|uniref:Double zinc ribbon n=1 Tax=Sporobacter termitidis DSM 10068 TaxID=1123282 RepID=A0A1M5ZL62_9FIRM|nr:hypothetical protein [Sporobacter termitidis]SHI24878.1 hypothetical protein SAMN02745823_03876 [Sporobacter termitidis DSM 10068]
MDEEIKTTANVTINENVVSEKPTYCGNCGAIMSSPTCSVCGSQVKKLRDYTQCPYCSAELHGRFCSACGRKVRLISKRKFLFIYFAALLSLSLLIGIFSNNIPGATFATKFFFGAILVSGFFAIYGLVSLIYVSIIKRSKTISLNILVLSCIAFAASFILFAIV